MGNVNSFWNRESREIRRTGQNSPAHSNADGHDRRDNGGGRANAFSAGAASQRPGTDGPPAVDSRNERIALPYQFRQTIARLRRSEQLLRNQFNASASPSNQNPTNLPESTRAGRSNGINLASARQVDERLGQRRAREGFDSQDLDSMLEQRAESSGRSQRRRLFAGQLLSRMAAEREGASSTNEGAGLLLYLPMPEAPEQSTSVDGSQPPLLSGSRSARHLIIFQLRHGSSASAPPAEPMLSWTVYFAIPRAAEPSTRASDQTEAEASTAERIDIQRLTEQALALIRAIMSSDRLSHEDWLRIQEMMGGAAAQRGVSKEAIEVHLKSMLHSERASLGGGQIAAQSCPICLAEYSAEDRVRELPCAHVFHADCIDAWLVLQNQCPLCRRPPIAVDQSS